MLLGEQPSLFERKEWPGAAEGDVQHYPAWSSLHLAEEGWEVREEEGQVLQEVAGSQGGAQGRQHQAWPGRLHSSRLVSHSSIEDAQDHQELQQGKAISLVYNHWYIWMFVDDEDRGSEATQQEAL